MPPRRWREWELRCGKRCFRRNVFGQFSLSLNDELIVWFSEKQVHRLYQQLRKDYERK